jgi:hypothetical protein
LPETMAADDSLGGIHDWLVTQSRVRQFPGQATELVASQLPVEQETWIFSFPLWPSGPFERVR